MRGTPSPRRAAISLLTLLVALGWGVTRLSRSTDEADRIDPEPAASGFRPGAVLTRTPALGRTAAPGTG